MLHYSIYYREDDYTGYSGSYVVNEKFKSRSDMLKFVRDLKAVGCYDIEVAFIYDDEEMHNSDFNAEFYG